MNARKTLIMGNLGLLAVLALVIAKLVLLPTRLTETLEPLSLQAQIPPASNTDLESADTSNYQDLTTSELFGSLGNNPAAPTDNSPPLILDHLQLVGTVTGPDSVARAIIQNSSEQTSGVYKLNERIDELQLVQISRNEVTLRHNQQTFKLQRTTSTATASRPDAHETVTATKVQRSEPQDSMSPVEFTEEVEVILKAAAVTPQTQDEQGRGIKLSRIDQFVSSKFSGFKEGDVIQSINGQQILSKKQMFQVLQKAKTQPLIDIEVLRNDKIVLLSFSQG